MEDRAQLTMSYVEFLAQLHKNVMMVSGLHCTPPLLCAPSASYMFRKANLSLSDFVRRAAWDDSLASVAMKYSILHITPLARSPIAHRLAESKLRRAVCIMLTQQTSAQ